jgi:integrase
MEVAKTEVAKEDERLPRGIFRRGGIYWIRYADLTGKIRREPGGGTVKLAETKLLRRRALKLEGKIPKLRMDKIAEAKAEAEAAKLAAASIVKFGAWIDDAVKHHQSHSSEAHAYDFDRKCIYLRARFENTPVQNMTRGAVYDWMEEAAEGGVTGVKEWGPANWNRYHSCFSSIFELAIERAIGDHQEPPLNPMRYIDRRTEKWKERYWSADEEEAINKATREKFPGYEDIFTLAIEVGYRKSEQLRAVVGDYNPETHKIAIHQRKTETAPEIRYVPLSDKGVAAYERLAASRKAGEPLVVNKFNRIGEAMGDIRWFDDVLIDAKITDELASWHVSRHTFCSRAVARGVPITDVKEYAGHSDLRTTSRYTHGIEGTSDVRNRAAMNGDRKSATQPSVEDLQKQIAALTDLVKQLTPRS